MRVALFCPFVLAPPHYGTDLELVQRHLLAGDEVTVLACDGELPACDANLKHRPERCTECIDIRTAGLRQVAPGVIVEGLHLYAPVDTEPPGRPSRFVDMGQVRQYRVGTFDIGYAALSSVIYHLRDAAFDLDRHAAMLDAVLGTAYRVYASMDRYLSQRRVDRVYVANSRFASTRGVMRACQQHGVECLVHDRGRDIQHYELYPGTFPHDRLFVDRAIREAWEASHQVTDRAQVAAEWFREKSVGIERTWKSFVAGQQDGLLPTQWDASRRNVVIFTSSEDEFVAIGEGWENPLYASELEGVQAIVDSLRADPHDLHVYVRVHPNLGGVDNRQTRGLQEIRAPFVTVIPPDAPISSYALLRNAEKVLTFGSTIGIEAVFWGVPSILAGMSFYRDLGGTYNPASQDEVMALLKSSLVPGNVDAALMYGYYRSTFGVPFQYYHADGIFSGTFMGADLWGSRALRPL